jgi:hypothetical protein
MHLAVDECRCRVMFPASFRELLALHMERMREKGATEEYHQDEKGGYLVLCPLRVVIPPLPKNRQNRVLASHIFL